MQNRPNQLPAEVALWVLQHDDRYPEVEFKVEALPVDGEFLEMHENWRQRFSHLIEFHLGAPGTIRFMYLGQAWFVRIIGDLTAQQRVEIAGMPTVGGYEVLSPSIVGIPLKAGEAPLAQIAPVPVEPHIYMSGLHMTGAELLDIVDGPQTDRKQAIIAAMTDKDWDTAKALLAQRH